MCQLRLSEGRAGLDSRVGEGVKPTISSSCQSNLAVINAVILRGQGESNFPEGHPRKVPPSNSDQISRQRMNVRVLRLLTTEH